jgi:D-3-phosphoglycerate dehydrogenase
MDNIDIPHARSKGIQCINTPDASSTAVAELAFTLMIALASKVTVADASMREGKWLKKELKRCELHGKTLGIMGLGRIGLCLAARARAFQMKVLGWHPDVYFTDVAAICQELDDVLSQADYISLHMPLVPETEGLINKQILAKFKDGACLINTARGKIIVEEDVAEALKSGKLGGYATDVWYSDPPGESALFDGPNTVFMPHVGASTPENMGRIAVIIEREIEKYLAGKKG